MSRQNSGLTLTSPLYRVMFVTNHFPITPVLKHIGGRYLNRTSHEREARNSLSRLDKFKRWRYVSRKNCLGFILERTQNLVSQMPISKLHSNSSDSTHFGSEPLSGASWFSSCKNNSTVSASVLSNGQRIADRIQYYVVWIPTNKYRCTTGWGSIYHCLGLTESLNPKSMKMDFL